MRFEIRSARFSLILKSRWRQEGMGWVGYSSKERACQRVGRLTWRKDGENMDKALNV
jgi:hypothetical protein